MLKNQKFGVEIEFTGITRRKAAGIVAKILGCEVGLVENDGYKTRTQIDSNGRKWKVQRDASIHPQGGTASDEYRVEFVTPPLNYDDIETLQKIVRAFKQEGAIANSSCGIHIHVDGANHNAVSLRRLVKFFAARQNLVYEGLKIAPSRSAQWCKPIATSLIDEMAKVKNISRTEMESIWYSRANDGYSGRVDHRHYNDTRYHGLNLHSFFSKGTVEFRLFNSTLHAGKIKAYVQFCLAVSAWAIESNDSINFRNLDGKDKEQRFDLWKRILRRRFGLVGQEFETCRHHMLAGFRTEAAA